MSANKAHFFDTYLRRLTNLSGNNRAIFLPRLRSEQFIDLHYLSQLNGEPSFSLIEAALQRKKKTLCAVVDSRLAINNEASKKLKRLQRTDQLIFEERGVKDLHIGWPFVHGRLVSGHAIRCPLLLIPVDLVVEKEHWVIKPKDNANITFNKLFLLAYFFYNQVAVEESLLEETFEDMDKDSLAFRTALYERLKESTIDLHFNPDNYRDELISFHPFLKKDFEDTHEQGRLKLFPEAVLGIFPQSGSHLAPDYLTLIEENKIKDLESFFAKKKQTLQHLDTLHQAAPRIEEKNRFVGYQQDAWQERILQAVKAGHSIIASGPPGTGKSQLICQIIGDAIATKKKVLLVCQKRAALEVVYKRLSELQLEDFVAPVHDFKNDRKTIYAKAAHQIQSIDQYTLKNNSLDTIQMDRQFIQTSNRIDHLVAELQSFKNALFDTSECGVSVKELYLQSNPEEASIDLTNTYLQFPVNTIQGFISTLNAYAHYARQFDRPEYPLRDRPSFATFNASEGKKMEAMIEKIPATVTHIQQQLYDTTGQAVAWKHAVAWSAQRDEIAAVLQHLTNADTYLYFQYMLPRTEEKIDTSWLDGIAQNLLDCFDGAGPETTLPTHQLAAVKQTLSSSIALCRQRLGVLRWHLFSKDKPLLKKILAAHGLTPNELHFLTLEEKIDRRMALEQALATLKNTPSLMALPEGYDKVPFTTWLTNQRQAIKAAQLMWSIRDNSAFINPHGLRYDEFKKRVKKTGELLAPIPSLVASWHAYLSASQMDSLTAHPETCTPFRAVLHQDFDALREFDTLKKNLSPDEQSVIHKMGETPDAWTHPEALFTNSLYLAWIDHIETTYPVLRIVSSGKMHLLETELRELITKKQNLSQEIMLMHARESITLDLEYNQLHNRVTYRDLLHQLTKKRKIWPIRRLMATFSEDVFRLLPCWMASPESVSAIFPLEESFDIVIFDEASQCFAEHGIPAIYRGRQVVIAGDHKQLRPNDLYRLRWKEEEELPDLEVDALLDLAERHLKQLPLRTHYRSKNRALIDFSNHHFYDGQLQFVPHFEHYHSPTPPIVYHQVEGQWENSTNMVEAEEVTRLVVEAVDRHPQKELGVVTFNAPQQSLIMDLLEEAFAQRGENLPASLVVKNIENIQGDEKDIIIFSIGYAPGKIKKFNMQFGSLNVQGGENRLNVAITRAREQVIVVTSIQPHQLHVEHTQNEGPKLLKKYLHYAQAVSERNRAPFIPKDSERPAGHSLKRAIQMWSEKNSGSCPFKNDEFPFVDLSVHTRDGQIQLFRTDDDVYYQSPSVKDFHALTPHILEQKKWRYTTLYSRNYWQNRRAFFDRLRPT